MKYQPIIRLLDPFIELFTQSPYSPQSTWIARIVISCIICLLIIAFIRAFCDFEKWYYRRKMNRKINLRVAKLDPKQRPKNLHDCDCDECVKHFGPTRH